MFSWKPFLRFVHRFAGFWFLLECLLSCSWRKPGRATKSDPSVSSTRSALSSSQQSFEKASLENGSTPSEYFMSHSPSVFMVDMENSRNGVVLGKASVQLEEGPIHPFQGGCGGASEYSSRSTPGSRDLSEPRRDLVLEDDVVFGVLASVSSVSDNASYGAETSDEFSSAVESIREVSIEESTPCWMKVAEAEWRTEVAVAMDAFRACRDADEEPIFIFSEDSKRRSLDSIALQPNQQIQEIQNWRSYLGGDGDTSLTSEGHGVDTSFQFP